MKDVKQEKAGRPKATNPASKLVTMRMTPQQQKAFLERGGSRWVKRMLTDLTENDSQGLAKDRKA